MKSPVQRMIAQRRLALVTERTPLQPGNVSEETKLWGYVGCDFGVDGGSTAAYFVSGWVPIGRVKLSDAESFRYLSDAGRKAILAFAEAALFRPLPANLRDSLPGFKTAERWKRVLED